MAHPSFLEQAGPDPRPLHSTGVMVDQPGESLTASVSSEVLQTVESQIAVLPALMTTSRSELLAVKVHAFLDVELIVSSMSTTSRVFWSAGTDGLMRIDSGSHACVPDDRATVVVPSVGAGFGVGDGVVVGADADTGRSSLPSGQKCTPSHAMSRRRASRSRRRRQ